MTLEAENTEKKRRSLKPLADLLPYLARYKGLVAGALAFLCLAAVTTLALPIAIRRMLDHGFNASDSEFINKYFAMMIVMALVLAVASALRYYYVITIGERVVADLRSDVFTHVTRLSPAFFDINQSGEIVSRLTADTTQLKSAVGATASLALRNSILCLGAMVMMIATSPKLSIMVLAAIPVIVFPLVAFGRSVRKRSRAAQDTLAEASSYAGEVIGAARTLQAFNAEETARSRYVTAVESAYEAARSAIKSRALLTGVAISLVFGSVVGVLWYGAQSVLAGTMTAGTLGQFLLYSLIAAGSLGTLSEVFGEMSQAAGAAERLHELLAEHPEIAAPANPVALPMPARGSVDFEAVQFSYPSAKTKSALKGLSFSVAHGETVAIVGPSGAGKSTIFSLILRFYDPASGTIRLDGVDIREADPKAVRDRIAIVPQDTTIFASSIHDNIAFGTPGATRAMVEAAADAAQASEFIGRQVNGFDTLVGERGITLSGGQRQRIAIARALLRNAPLLLLDEATSALDAESETLVQKALDGLMRDRTTIVIAHRLATVLKADRILVLDDGRIVEEGTHQSLIQQGGLYAKLARLQFETGGRDFTAAAQ
ncbi:ABC transporter transmembrane domain-containing protein [Rhizobium glycinendophyticum]|uniref:ATP-binding cassette domain-containing protein n=1 Tax=Rhizobium glycinendophyticum TaxID=2589807 RepID=A0A504UDW3_9HYPH|nr:ABC transporter transmembrane domain-containing protein [Rhizobium glycinendophyticum]TPP11947.1 ATP-binding cassette domain-containing protein [Rhizobium glycinendophyticum]